jgi:hypothetical protein
MPARRVPGPKTPHIDPWLGCAALLALIPILTIVRPGMPNTADGQVHLLRALEASSLLRAGVLYPRWAPDFYLGYGYPFFNFYAPGAHILVSWLALAGLGVLRGMVAAQVLGLLLYPTGAYLLAKALLAETARCTDTLATGPPSPGAAGPSTRPVDPARRAERGQTDHPGFLGRWRRLVVYDDGAKFVPLAALLCAALYLYAPLRWRELFTQGNLSQLLALGLLPWSAWALTWAARRASPRWAAGAGFLLAALVYLHHPSALLAFPSLAVYALAVAVVAARGWGRKIASSQVAGRSSQPALPAMTVWRSVGAVVGAFCVGILLSAPFWLPSIAEQRYVNIANIEQGMFNARLNLLSLGELLSPARLQDEAALNPPMPNSLGLAQVVMALAGLATAVLWVIRKDAAEERRVGEGPTTVQRAAPAETAGQTVVSAEATGHGEGGAQDEAAMPGKAIVWGGTAGHEDPGYRAAQADDRLSTSAQAWWTRRQAGMALLVVASLLVVSLVVMLPVAAGAWEALPLARLIAFPWRMLGPALLWAALLGGTGLFLVPTRLRTPALAVLLVLAPLSIAPYLFPRAFAPASEPTLADIARYEMHGGARGTASANEYLPTWVMDPNPPVEMAVEMESGGVPNRLDRGSLPAGSEAETLLQAPLDDVFRLTLPYPATVHVRSFYFPGWQAWVDGSPASIEPDKPYGLIEVAVPAGTHEVRLRNGATPSQLAGGVLALVGLAFAGILVWRGPRDPEPEPAPTSDAPNGRTERTALLTAAGTILAMTAVLLLFVVPYTRWFRLRSSAEAPAEMEQPLHARFSNGIELIGYTLTRPAVLQGDAVEVRLFWRALKPQSEDVRPFLHLDSVTGDMTWANQTKLHAGDKPSSGWPSGFYVVDDYRLSIPADAPAVVGNLTVGLLDAAGDRIPLASGGDLAVLGPLRVRDRQPLSADTLPGRDQSYQLGPAVRLVGSSAAITGTPPFLDLTLYWQAVAPVPVDYTTFVHVLDAAGAKVAQADGPPLDGRYPSTAWQPGQIIADRRQIALPGGVDTAGVRVAIGLYTLADGARAPVVSAGGERQVEDRILLTPVVR